MHFHKTLAIDATSMMIPNVVHGVLGPRWQTTTALAENMVRRAIQEGFVSASKKDQRALDLKPSKTPPAKKPKRTSANKLILANSLVKVGQDAVAFPKEEKRLVTFDVLDCSLGTGQHTAAILDAAPYSRVVALDCDYQTKYAARSLAAHFGPDRFKFFGNLGSQAKTMFGERCFDAILVDFGMTRAQLDDPARGFLLDSEDDHEMDMRYGPQNGFSALHLLNNSPQHYLTESLVAYNLLNLGICAKIVRHLFKRRPLTSANEVLGIVQDCGGEIPEDGWANSLSVKKTPASLGFMMALRSVVNNEMFELRQTVLNALPMLRTEGRLVVLTKAPWEVELVKQIVKDHPDALLVYQERAHQAILQFGSAPARLWGDDRAEGDGEDGSNDFGTTSPRHVRMFVIARSNKSTFALKNAAITEDEVRDSATRWVFGMHGGQSKGFPAENFTFERKDFREKQIIKKNRSSDPPFDADDKHWK